MARSVGVVKEGSAAVMLSGETSVGLYPVQVVQAMARIAEAAEQSIHCRGKEGEPQEAEGRFLSNTVCFFAAQIANKIEAKAICTLTFSGHSAQLISSFRPHSDIYAFTANYKILNKLSLLWGVRGFYYSSMASTDSTFVDVTAHLKTNGFVAAGDRIVQLASMPIEAKGTTNTIRIKDVE